MPRIIDAAVMINNAYYAYNDADGVAQTRPNDKTLPLGGGWTLIKFVDDTGKGGDAAAIYKNHNYWGRSPILLTSSKVDALSLSTLRSSPETNLP